MLTHAACAGLIALLVFQAPDAVMHHFPRWSPDGGLVLASSTADGDPEIYLFPVDGALPRKLTDNDAADDGARWSLDGRRIFFTSDRRGRLEPFVMIADGTGQAPFDGPQENPTSPAGTRILETAVIEPARASDAHAVVINQRGRRPRGDGGRFFESIRRAHPHRRGRDPRSQSISALQHQAPAGQLSPDAFWAALTGGDSSTGSRRCSV